MAVTILAPRSGDTVTSPISCSCSYDFGMNSYNIAHTIAGANGSSGPFTASGLSLCALSVVVTVPTVSTLDVNAGAGGADSQPNITVTNSAMPPVIVDTITPMIPPPPPAQAVAAAGNNKRYDVSGRVKNANPKPDTVTCTAYEVNMANGNFNPVDTDSDSPNPGGNWKVKLRFDQNPGFAYTVVAVATLNGTVIGQFSKAIT